MHLPNCFHKQNIQLFKRHTEYCFQLSVSRAPRNTPIFIRCRARSLWNELHGIVPVFGMWHVFVPKLLGLFWTFWNFKRSRLSAHYLLLIWIRFRCSLIISNSLIAKMINLRCFRLKAEFVRQDQILKQYGPQEYALKPFLSNRNQHVSDWHE